MFQFFVLTLGGLWIAQIRDEDVYAKKLSNFHKALFRAGIAIQGCVAGIGTHLVAGAPEARFFFADPEVPEEARTLFITGRTEEIVGLFTERAAAVAASETPKLARYDFRWREETRRVLEAVGGNPRCYFLKAFGHAKAQAV